LTGKDVKSENPTPPLAKRASIVPLQGAPDKNALRRKHCVVKTLQTERGRCRCAFQCWAAELCVAKHLLKIGLVAKTLLSELASWFCGDQLGAAPQVRCCGEVCLSSPTA